MNRIIDLVLGTAAITAMAFFFAFAGINIALNCQTWDESLWTETSSCVTVSQLLD